MTSTTTTTTANNIDHTTKRKPASLIGMVPVDQFDSYDDVPWYRKQSFALFPLFFVANFFLALTGTIYAKATPTMRTHSPAAVWRYTAASRVFFVACDVFVFALIAWNLWR